MIDGQPVTKAVTISAIPLKDDVGDCFKQRVSRANEFRDCLAWSVNERLFKADAFVAVEHRFAPACKTAVRTNDRGHIRDLVPLGLALAQGPAEHAKSFNEEGGEKVRLKAASFDAFHFLADFQYAYSVERFVRERSFFQQCG